MLASRNESCPCGSGKKYKHCCLRFEGERLAAAKQVAASVRRGTPPSPAPAQAVPDRYAPLQSSDNCQRLTNDLMELPPAEFGRQDFALMNLLCAPALPGSESLDIARCLARLDHLTAFVKAGLDRSFYRFPNDPDYGHCEPMWRMAMLVTIVKLDFGATYSPSARADLEAGIDAPFSDSREIFVHGLLDDNPNRRWGTCTSIPVLVTAVARRLGYPVGLAVTRTHIYCRWENGCCFNIEASNPAGMASPPDEHYIGQFMGGMMAEEKASGHFCRTLHPAEEFAAFCMLRVDCLMDAARYDETLLWSARALQYAPDHPHFPKVAAQAMDLGMKSRLRRKHPEQQIPASDDPRPFSFNVGDLLRIPERSCYLTICAHHKERLGEIDAARRLYEDACRHNVYGHNEQRDLQRFLRKYGRPLRKGPLLPPKNLGQPRRFKLMCSEIEEAPLLFEAAWEYERAGRMLDARNALLELYTFDPCDAELYDRLRTMEKNPRFQEQLIEHFKQRGQSPQPAVILPQVHNR